MKPILLITRDFAIVFIISIVVMMVSLEVHDWMFGFNEGVKPMLQIAGVGLITIEGFIIALLNHEHRKIKRGDNETDA